MPPVERSDSHFHPTEAGLEILGATKRIEAALSECDASLELLHGLGPGRVAVGVISTAKYFAPMAIAGFAHDHPEVEIRLVVGNRGETIAVLAESSIDIAVMGRPPEEPNVEADVLGDHPHIIIVPPDHPLVGHERINIAELTEETFLVREQGSGTRQLTERVLAEMNMTAPRFGMEISSNETIKQAVMAGLGIALLSAHTCAMELEAGRDGWRCWMSRDCRWCGKGMWSSGPTGVCFPPPRRSELSWWSGGTTSCPRRIWCNRKGGGEERLRAVRMPILRDDRFRGLLRMTLNR